MAKRVFVWGGIAFLLFFIAYRPSFAEGVFKNLGGIVTDVFNGVVNFLGGLI
jgi:hypothetical protein